jgi:hypothetical protein
VTLCRTDSDVEQQPDEAAAAAFSWRAHPARERPAAGALAVGVIVAASLLVGTSAGAWWGVFSAAVLVLSLSRFLLASRFTIDDEGVTARYPFGRQRLAWQQVRRMHVDAHGGYLSTRSRPSRLDAYRGMHLLFGGARDAVLAEIRRRMDAAAGGEDRAQGGTSCAG